jgi:hypothetical protein
MLPDFGKEMKIVLNLQHLTVSTTNRNHQVIAIRRNHEQLPNAQNTQNRPAHVPENAFSSPNDPRPGLSSEEGMK